MFIKMYNLADYAFFGYKIVTNRTIVKTVLRIVKAKGNQTTPTKTA